jgi:ATP-dependent Lon protease
MNNEREIGEKPMSARKKLSALHRETRITLEHLRGLRNRNASDEREAQIVQEKMGHALLDEKKELRTIAEKTNDTLAQAFAETREKEIEKELVDIEIEWREKQAYDLKVNDGSPQLEKDKKTKILRGIEWVKRGDLLLAITDCVGALREEKRLLEEIETAEEKAERLRYVDEQIKKMETEFGKIKNLEE